MALVVLGIGQKQLQGGAKARIFIQQLDVALVHPGQVSQIRPKEYFLVGKPQAWDALFGSFQDPNGFGIEPIGFEAVGEGGGVSGLGNSACDGGLQGRLVIRSAPSFFGYKCLVSGEEQRAVPHSLGVSLHCPLGFVHFLVLDQCANPRLQPFVVGLDLVRFFEVVEDAVLGRCSPAGVYLGGKRQLGPQEGHARENECKWAYFFSELHWVKSPVMRWSTLSFFAKAHCAACNWMRASCKTA